MAELADSLKNAREEIAQVIWVDDGSQDRKGYDRLKERLIDDKKHHFISLEKNKGVAGAINYGISLANENSYIITMGSDDIFAKDYIQKVKTIFDKYPYINIVVPQIECIGAESGIIDPLLKKDLNIFKFFKKNRVFAASAFRKSIWEKIGGFDETLRGNYEDWDFWFRCALQGAFFYELKEVGYYYRIRKNSLSSSINNKSAKRKLIKKWILLLILMFFKNPIFLLKNIKIRVCSSNDD